MKTFKASVTAKATVMVEVENEDGAADAIDNLLDFGNFSDQDYDFKELKDISDIRYWQGSADKVISAKQIEKQKIRDEEFKKEALEIAKKMGMV